MKLNQSNKKIILTVTTIFFLFFIFTQSSFGAAILDTPSGSGGGGQVTADETPGFNVSVPPAPKTAKSLMCIVIFMALDFVPYIFVIAVGAFLMGLIKYVGSGDNEEKRGEGTKMMVYGIVGLFFMISVWGILQIFTNSFNLPFGIPQFNEKIGKTGTGKGCSNTTSTDNDFATGDALDIIDYVPDSNYGTPRDTSSSNSSNQGFKIGY